MYLIREEALQEGEGTRLYDLVHLVKRSYNTLKEVGVASDIAICYQWSKERCVLVTERYGQEI